MQISDEMKALEALARAYDHEEAACMGEPSPWVSADAEGDDEWKAERIVAARAGLDAYRAALSLPVQPVAWRDDPSADERWNAGLDFGMSQLCAYLGVDTNSVTWDAATETLDGDVRSVIGNILRAKYGEDWGPTLGTPPVPPTKGPEDDLIAAREAAAQAAEVFGGYGMAAAFRAGDHDDKGTVRAALLAIRSERTRRQ